MSYQVLARKWRPQGFSQLIGQQHVVKALSHALTHQRLHHAYLFTGTRGVGKTTLSRILAKSLNCELGISATPCGQCSACIDIDGGVFTDYIEMDAASHRGVDDMSALLDRAVYAPARGRYKIYMIDEVHMLSNTAFNAMLKTLEEPPEYLKFILATTDPQKIPVTVLSRCLQFVLKPMTVAQISDYLTSVLLAESIPNEPVALNTIAKSAQGSMRDALSILDQAIAHGSGTVFTKDVQQMLGIADTSGIYTLMQQLANKDTPALLLHAQSLLDAGIPATNILDEIATIASQLAIYESLKTKQDASFSKIDPLLAPLIHQITPEHLQLIYGIATQSQADIAYAPNDYAALAMPLLRMQIFAPYTPSAHSTHTTTTHNSSIHSTNHSINNTDNIQSNPIYTIEKKSTLIESPQTYNPQINHTSTASTHTDYKQPPTVSTAHTFIPESSVSNQNHSFNLTQPEHWPGIANQLPLTGMARVTARESACSRIDGLNIYLVVSSKQMADTTMVARVQESLRSVSGIQYTLHINIVDSKHQMHKDLSHTAVAHAKAEQHKQHIQDKQTFINDPVVKDLVSLGGQIIEETITRI